MSTPRQQAREAWWVVWPALAGAVSIWTFFAVGDTYFGAWTLDVGNVDAPRPGYAYFLLFYVVFGGLGAGFMGLGAARFATYRLRKAAPVDVSDQQPKKPDLWWIVLGSIAAAVVPLTIRALVLDGSPITDDESCYQFMAELLASGRLTTESPPMREFYDRVFMINDGRLYAMYFVGWPALMAPGVWLGMAGSMNAVYSALTVPALFLVVRRLSSSQWAKVAVLLYLVAPHLMILAATQMAHTTCIMALAWLTWFCLRSRDPGSPWWSHAGVAFMFSVAFFIRPLDALGVGLPLLAFWAVGLSSVSRRERGRSAIVFLAPALVMAALFFSVNQAQTGSFTTTAYERDIQVAREAGVEGTTYSSMQENLDAIEVPHFGFEYSMMRAVGSTGVGLLRFNFSLLGWPCSFLFVFFAVRRREERWLWASAACQLAFLFFVLDPGIDSFGPPHYSSLGWPVLLLSVLGIRNLTERLEARSKRAVEDAESGLALRFLPGSVVVGLVLVTFALYLPSRLGMLTVLASDINRPRNAVAEAGLHDAVVFADIPFAPTCNSHPARHFVFWRPNNDPDLENDVLWVNHYTVESDRVLAESLSDRTGYIMRYTEHCQVLFLPLDTLEPGSVPDGFYP